MDLKQGSGRTAWAVALGGTLLALPTLSGWFPRGAPPDDDAASNPPVAVALHADQTTTRLPTTAITTPFDQFMLTAREAAIVDHARSVLVSQCMNEAGHQFEVAKLSALIARAEWTERQTRRRTFGITDGMEASSHGYVPAEPPFALPPQPPTSAVYWKRLIGDGPSGQRGCVGLADSTLGRDPSTSPLGLGHDLWIQSFARLEAEPRARAAIADWTACMAEGGFKVTSPITDEGDIKRTLLSRAPGSTRATDDEIDLAMADIACKQQTRTVRRLSRVSRRLDEQLIARHHAALSADRKRLDALVEFASVVNGRASESRQVD